MKSLEDLQEIGTVNAANAFVEGLSPLNDMETTQFIASVPRDLSLFGITSDMLNHVIVNERLGQYWSEFTEQIDWNTLLTLNFDFLATFSSSQLNAEPEQVWVYHTFFSKTESII